MKLYRTHGKEARLRRGPEHTAEVMTVLPAGTEVEVLEEVNHFVKVRVRDKYQADQVGYLAAGFLADYAATDPPQKEIVLAPCPRCQAEEWAIYPLTGGTGSVPHVRLDFFTACPLRVRICLQCGLLEPCLDQENLQYVREDYKRKAAMRREQSRRL